MKENNNNNKGKFLLSFAFLFLLTITLSSAITLDVGVQFMDSTYQYNVTTQINVTNTSISGGDFYIDGIYFCNNNATVTGSFSTNNTCPTRPGIEQGINVTHTGNPGTNPVLANFTSYGNVSNPAQSLNHYTLLSIDNDLLGWYTFDFGGNLSDVIDGSGNGNNLDITTNSPTINDSSVYYGQNSLQMVEGNGEQKISTNSITVTQAGWTIGFYIKVLEGIDQDYDIMEINAGGSTDVVVEFTSSGGGSCGSGQFIQVDIDNSGDAKEIICVDFNPGVSRFVTIVFNGTHTIGYANGAESNVVTDSMSANITGQVRLGNGGTGASNFGGILDEITIFARPLTANEVLSLYNADTTQYKEFHNLSIGSHQLTGYAVNSLGGMNTTGYVTVAVNNLTLTSINLTDVTTGSNSSASPNNNIQVAGDVRGNETAPKNVFYDWKVNGTSIVLMYIPMDGVNTTACIDYGQPTTHSCTPVSTGAIQYSSNKGFNGRGTYDFDGDDYINVNPDMNTQPHENWTVTYWFNSTVDSASDQIIFSDGGTEATRQQLHLGIRANGDYFCDLFGDATTYSGGGGVEGDRQYHSGACSFDASTNNLSLFLDGNLVSSSTTSGGLNAGGETLIGARTAGPVGFWNGHIDEVIFWNRTLSHAMITQLNSNTGTNDVIVSDETVIDETWQACGTPNDNTENNTIALGTNSFCSNTITIETLQDVFVNDLQPNGGDEEVGELMNISVNVTAYTGNITLVQANITAPNGTSYIVNLSNITNNQFDNNYSGEFNVSAILGQFNYTITATGNESGLNNTENNTFVAVDTTPPLVNNVTPANLTEVNLTTNVTISVNATDVINNSAVLATLTYPNATEVELVFENNSLTRYNLTFNIPQQIGNYTFQILANDTSGNENDSITLWIQGIDVDAPNVTAVIPQNVTIASNQSVLISANITDEINVSGAFVNVSYPNGTTLDYQLENTSVDLYNITFNDTTQIGTYNITIWAVDSSGNVNNTETGNFTVSNVCGEIDRSTTLTGNITGSQLTCLNVTASDVVLDCNGFTVENSGGGNNVLTLTADNITINNCRMISGTGVTVEGTGTSGGVNINNSYFSSNTATTMENVPLGVVQNSVFIGHSISFAGDGDGIFVDNTVTTTGTSTLAFFHANNVSRNIVNNTASAGGMRFLTSNTVIEDNVVSAGASPLWLDSGSGYNVSRNSFSLESGTVSSVMVLDTAANEFQDNNLTKGDAAQGWVQFTSATLQQLSNTVFLEANFTLTYGNFTTATDITGTSINFTTPDTVTVNTQTNPDLNVTADIQMDNAEGSVIVVDKFLNGSSEACDDFPGLCSNVVYNASSRKLTFTVSEFSAYSSNLSSLNVTTVIVLPDPVTLTQNISTTIEVVFNVSSNVALNDTTATCSITKDTITVDPISCTNVTAGATARDYVCNVNLSYYQPAGNDWNANCTVSGNAGDVSYNDTNFTVNTLTALTEQAGSIDWNWAGALAGSTTLADAPIILLNIGNTNFSDAYVTGYPATDDTNFINASSFILHNVSTGSAGGITMADNTSVNYSSNFELPAGNESSVDIYAYLSLAGDTVAGNYYTTQLWNIAVS